MSEHPCLRHQPGRHTEYCLTGRCGFCDAKLADTPSGECRTCLLIVCEQCDAGYDPDLGPICTPCAHAAAHGTGRRLTLPEPAEGEERVRLCVFKFSLSCGHLVTVALTGWYPVVLACCDRLGGTLWRGEYVPFASDIEYVNLLSERNENRPAGTPRERDRLIGRQPRTDDPSPPDRYGIGGTAGRYPARVGATLDIDSAGDIRNP